MEGKNIKIKHGAYIISSWKFSTQFLLDIALQYFVSKNAMVLTGC